MTDTFAAERRRIERVWRQWQWLLPEWDITQRYFEGAFSLVNDEGSGPVIAEARANWRYLNGNVRWNLAIVREIGDVELEETAVHEMIHFILNELNSGDDGGAGDRTAHEERVTTTLSRLLIKQKGRA